MKKLFVLFLIISLPTFLYAQKFKASSIIKKTKPHINLKGNEKDLSASNIICTNYYVPGTTMSLDLVVTLNTPDFEYGDSVSITFPAGITPTGVATDPIAPASQGYPAEALNGVVGQTITWGDNDNSWGGLEPGSWSFFVEVTVDAGLTGDYVADYYISGDEYANPMAASGTFIINEVPTCPPPTGITGSNITNNSADISWTTGGAVNWNIEWGVLGFSLGTGNYVADISSPYSLQGLTAGTTYSVYVQDSCAVDDVSPWSGPYTFTTQASCPPSESLDALNITINSAELSWVSGGGSNWNVQIGEYGFTLGQGTIYYDVTSPLVVSGLSSGITYEFYVQDSCGPGDLSAWVISPWFNTLVSCPNPTSGSMTANTDTSATISWTTGGAANWNLEWGPAGFTQGTGNIITDVTNPVTIDGLTPGESYQFYVQDSCGAGDVSSWAGPFSFNPILNCGLFGIPYSEGFEGTATEFSQLCWTSIDEDTDGYNWYILNSGGHSGARCAASNSYENGAGALTPENWLISPEIDLTGETGTISLEYWISPMDPAWPEEHYKVVASTTGTTPADFTDILFEETLTGDPAGYINRIINVSAYNGQTVYFAWVHYNCSDMWVITLDDILIQENTSIDLGIADLVSPSTDASCTLSSSENITVELFNYGGTSISNFDISYTCPQINGGTPVVETVTGTALPSQSFQYTFSTPVDMSALVSYDFSFEITNVTGDQNATNNTYAHSITNNDAMIQIHAFTDFGYDQQWTITNTLNSTNILNGMGWPGAVEIMETACVMSDQCYSVVINDVNGMLTGGAYLEILYNGVQVAGSTTPQSFTGPSLSALNIGAGCVSVPNIQIEGKLNFEYASVPQSQVNVNSFTFSGKVSNNEATLNDPAKLMLSINGGAYTDSVDIVVPFIGGMVQNLDLPGTFVPAGIDQFEAVFSADIPNDFNLTNNFDTLHFEVSDSVFAREDGTITGGVGDAAELYLGQQFDIIEPNYGVTSVSFCISNTIIGSSVSLNIYSDNNGQPGSVIGGTDDLVFTTNAQNSWFTLNLTDAVPLQPGRYYLILKTPETNDFIAVATSDRFYKPNTTWVSFDNISWGSLDDYGFQVSLALRMNINSYTNLGLSVVSTEASCQQDDGSAVATVSNGVSPFTYQWSNGDTGAFADSLASGTHSVQVVDANGDSDLIYFTINSSDGPVVTMNSVTDVSCYNGSNGTIDIDITGGTPPYTINWSNGYYIEDISGLASGMYTVIVTDDNGCVSSNEFTIAQPTALNVSVSTDDATCGSANGSATASVTGGTPPYSYSWSNGETTQVISGLSADIYTITVTDDNGCVRKINSGIVINSIGGPIITLDSVSNTSCGGSDGAIYISVASVFQGVSYMWSNWETTEDIDGLSPGVYFVQVVDSNGCIGTYSKEILAISPQEQSICAVTVDSASGRNMIIWEKDQPVGIDHYNIYREGNMAGQYYLSGSVPFDSMSEYIDSTSNPMVRAYRYKLSSVDECGNESPLSQHHKTMHMTMNEGIGLAYNLIWDHYEGFEFWTYLIYRHTQATGWELIDSMPSSLTSYTDWPPSLQQLYYRVSVLVPVPCYPESSTKAQGGPYSQSYSNMDDNAIQVGIAPVYSNKDLKLYPNPTNGKVTIVVTGENAEWYEVEICSLHGQTISRDHIEADIDGFVKEYDLSKFSKGVYFVKVRSSNYLEVSKLIIK